MESFHILALHWMNSKFAWKLLYEFRTKSSVAKQNNYLNSCDSMIEIAEINVFK